MPRTKGARNKKKVATEKQIADMKKRGVDPKEYIESCMLDPANFDPIKMRAAETLMEYTHAKLARNTVTGALGIGNIKDMTEDQLMELAKGLGLLGVID